MGINIILSHTNTTTTAISVTTTVSTEEYRVGFCELLAVHASAVAGTDCPRRAGD